MFLEYCHKGEAIYKPDVLMQRRLQLKSCIDFIKFCNKYNLGQVVDAAGGALRRLFKCVVSKHLEPEDVGHLANCLDRDNNIFKLLMQARVREMLREDALRNRSRLPLLPFEKKFGEFMRADETVATGMMIELVAQRLGEARLFACPQLEHWKAGW